MPAIGYSHRPVALGRRGMVAAAHPDATLAGIEVLKSRRDRRRRRRRGQRGAGGDPAQQLRRGRRPLLPLLRGRDAHGALLERKRALGRPREPGRAALPGRGVLADHRPAHDQRARLCARMGDAARAFRHPPARRAAPAGDRLRLARVSDDVAAEPGDPESSCPSIRIRSGTGSSPREGGDRISASS